MTGSHTSRTPSEGTRSPRAATAVVFLVNGAGLGLWAGHIPVLKAGLGLDATALGLTLLTMAPIAMPLAGLLTGTAGSRLVCMASGVVFGLALGLPLLTTTIPLLLTSALLLGAANGTMDVAMNTQASAVEAAFRRPLMSGFHAFFSVGGLTGAAAAAGLLALGTHPAVHMALLGLLLAGVAILAGPGLLPGRDPRGVVLALPSRRALGLGVLVALTMLTEGGIMDWSAVYLVTTASAPSAVAALGYGAFSVSMLLARWEGDRLVRALGRGPALAWSGAIAAAGLLLAAGSGSVVLGILGFGVGGLGLANTVPLLFSTAGRLPGIAPGMAVAMVATFGYTGLLLGPPMIGIVADASSLRIALLLLVPAVLAVAFFGPRILVHSSRVGQ